MRKEELMNLLIEESGSTRQKAAIEVQMGIRYIHEAAMFPLLIKREVVKSVVPNKENIITRSPVGVVSVITHGISHLILPFVQLHQR